MNFWQVLIILLMIFSMLYLISIENTFDNDIAYRKRIFKVYKQEAEKIINTSKFIARIIYFFVNLFLIIIYNLT